MYILILFPAISYLFAEQSLTIKSSLTHESIAKNIKILIDQSATLSIDDVSSAVFEDQFFSTADDQPGFGFTSAVFWVRLDVNNPQNIPVSWYLEIGYPLLDFIDLYIPDTTGSFSVRKTGDMLPFNSRDVFHRNFVFNLSEQKQSSKSYYLRMQTSSSMNFPIHFWLPETFYEYTSPETLLLGIFYGAFIIMIIYNILLYVGFLDKSYIYYVFFITFWGLTQLAINGLAFQYLWNNWIWWANINIPVFIFLSVYMATQFSRSLLNTPLFTPQWDKLLKVVNIFFIGGALFSFFIPYEISIRIAAGSGLSAVALSLITAALCLRKKVRSAYFFIIAMGLYFIGVILFALKSFGVLPGNFITNWSIQIGAFSLLILFSIAVQDRINKERKEKFLAQKAALINEQKLVGTLTESERVLEEKVNERTKKLSEINTSLEKSSQDLQESANELDTLNDIVKIISREIEFEKVINALLEQGLKLIPQAQQGAALIYDPDADCYDFSASIGYKLQLFEGQHITIEDLKKDFFSISEEVVKGIFIIRITDASNKKAVFNLTNSKSMLAMSISLDGQLAGFLIFDNNDSYDAFDQSDAHKLSRFRSHAISAFTKARLLQELKRINEEMIRTRDQLIVQEKMASLGQLTAGIAHEIKNPLNFVNNFAEGSVELTAELLEELEKHKSDLNKEDFEELEELINDLKQNALDIFENGKRADSIVRSMMDHARGSSGELRKVDINALVEENINLAYHGYRAIDSSFNVTINKNYSKSLPEIEVIQADIGRVLLNILNNACYAVLEKQKEAGNTFIPELTISTKSLKNWLEIHLHDNGPGIPQKVREKIFNPFFTTKATGEGNTGLGLSISYEIIVQEHHGKLEVQSKEGKFTKFIISLPITKK